jgi:hypothetical protein
VASRRGAFFAAATAGDYVVRACSAVELDRTVCGFVAQAAQAAQAALDRRVDSLRRDGAQPRCACSAVELDRSGGGLAVAAVWHCRVAALGFSPLRQVKDFSAAAVIGHTVRVRRLNSTELSAASPPRRRLRTAGLRRWASRRCGGTSAVSSAGA